MKKNGFKLSTTFRRENLMRDNKRGLSSSGQNVGYRGDCLFPNPHVSVGTNFPE